MKKNILRLATGSTDTNNLSRVIDVLRNEYTLTNKTAHNNISAISYDAYIITANYLNKYYLEDQTFFDNLEKYGKPIIIIYDRKNNSEDIILKVLAEKYKISFINIDSSVIECDEFEYKPSQLKKNGTSLGINFKFGTGFCNVKHTNTYFWFKKGNINIIHDSDYEINDYNYMNKSTIDNLLCQGVQILIKQLLNSDSAFVPKVNQEIIENILILNDKELNENISKIEEQINELNYNKNELVNIKKKNDHYKALLYSQGDELVHLVKEVLQEMLNVTIDDYDIKKQDLFFKLDNINILVEVKGINTSIKRQNVGQAKNHVRDFANNNDIYADDINKYCKGLLIINPFDKDSLTDKINKDFYSKEVISDLKSENICAIDTYTLLNYYSKWKNDNNSIDLKNIILNETYVPKDFQDILNF